MKTTHVLASLPPEYSADRGDPRVAGPLARAVLAAAGPSGAPDRGTRSSQSVAARAKARERVEAQFEEARLKFNPQNQPRNTEGKFRKVLARLKMNLGDQANEQLAKEMEEAEAAGAIGDYANAKNHASEVVKLVQNVKEGDLKKGTLNNIRKGATDLGKLLAYLPLPQGDTSKKVRFSDLPAPTASLIQNLIKRVEGQLDNEDAAKYVTILRQFMSGARTMSSDEMSAELSKVLRVLG